MQTFSDMAAICPMCEIAIVEADYAALLKYFILAASNKKQLDDE